MTSVPIKNRFLICAEPITVNPLQYSYHVRRAFSQIIEFKPSLRTQASHSVPIGGSFNPQYRANEMFANHGTRKGCIILNQNKFSLISDSNYALRNRFIRAAWNQGIPLTVGGRDWNRGLSWTFLQLLYHAMVALRAHQVPSLSQITNPIPRRFHRHLLGPIDDELELLSRFRTCVVIENESSYVSEKIFQALRAGCQCVYVGPRLNSSDFPKGFLYPAERSASDICQSVTQAIDSEYSIESWQIRDWFETSTFAQVNSIQTLTSSISEQIWAWLFSSL